MSQEATATLAVIAGVVGAGIGAAISGGFSFFVWWQENKWRREVARNELIYAVQEALYEASDLTQDLMRSMEEESDAYVEFERLLRRQLNRFLILNLRLGDDALERGASVSMPIADVLNARRNGHRDRMLDAAERLYTAQDIAMDTYLDMAKRV